jgi:hypothetical protein
MRGQREGRSSAAAVQAVGICRLAAANRPPPSQNDVSVTKRGNRMKSIRTHVAIGIIKLAATLCGLALVVAPWPLAEGHR